MQQVECMCCCSEMNVNAGISCPAGHFVCCSATPTQNEEQESCFLSLLDSQIQSIDTQDGQVLCPICKDPFKSLDMARCTSDVTWSKLQEAQVDAKVSKQVVELQQQFDERLDRQVKDLMDKYTKGDGIGCSAS